MHDPDSLVPSAAKDDLFYARRACERIICGTKQAAEMLSRRTYSEIRWLYCATRSITYQPLFDLPVSSGLYPRQLWDAGFHGLTTSLIPAMLTRACETDLPVFIQAETGTGKDILARFIHRSGSRREKTLVPVNCAAFPNELLYSELFGHKKGAFTGATNDKPGRFEQANGGTIFLDEIGDLEPRVQLALLRVLQNKKISPLGSTEEQVVDVRTICATHRNICTPAGREKLGFRDDLYYRLRVLPLDIPPIRECLLDLIFLFLLFLHDEAKRPGPECCLFPVGLIEEMLWHSWPGNVRELRHFAQFYLQYCLDLRERNRRRFRKGNLHAFFSQNDALREFIGEEPFNEVREKTVRVSQPLMDSIGGLDYFKAIGVEELTSLVALQPPGHCESDLSLIFSGPEKMVRLLLALASGNEEYLHRFSPDPTKLSDDSVRSLFHADNSTFRKYPDVRDRIERDYFGEVIRRNPTATDNEISRIAGVHHNTVKKIRERHKLSLRINPNRPPSSTGDNVPASPPASESPQTS